MYKIYAAVDKSGKILHAVIGELWALQEMIKEDLSQYTLADGVEIQTLTVQDSNPSRYVGRFWKTYNEDYQVLKRTLLFYANGKNYFRDEVEGEAEPIMRDLGKRARARIAELEDEPGEEKITDRVAADIRSHSGDGEQSL